MAILFRRWKFVFCVLKTNHSKFPEIPKSPEMEMGWGEMLQIDESIIIWVKLYSGTDILQPLKMETKLDNREIQKVCETELKSYFPFLKDVKIFERE